MYTYIKHIYIYIERERERERARSDAIQSGLMPRFITITNTTHTNTHTATCKINGDREMAVNVFKVVKPTGNVRWKICDSHLFLQVEV
jgi:hypothetical protein